MNNIMMFRYRKVQKVKYEKQQRVGNRLLIRNLGQVRRITSWLGTNNNNHGELTFYRLCVVPIQRWRCRPFQLHFIMTGKALPLLTDERPSFARVTHRKTLLPLREREELISCDKRVGVFAPLVAWFNISYYILRIYTRTELYPIIHVYASHLALFVLPNIMFSPQQSTTTTSVVTTKI